MRASIPHVDEFIHLNNASASLPDRAVYGAVAAHLDLEARMGSTEAMLEAGPRLAAVYEGLAAMTGTAAERISLGPSNNAVWIGAVQAIPLGAGGRILVGETEWGGNLSAIWRLCQTSGAEMAIVPSDGRGAMDPGALRAMLDGRVRLVCVTLAPAVNGLVNPLAALAEALADHPAWLVVDAAQAFCNCWGAFDLPRVDVWTAPGRKFLRAPRGTGFAVYSPRFLEALAPAAVDQISAPWGAEGPALRAGARRFELAERAVAIQCGFEAAVAVARGRDAAADRAAMAAKAAALREALAGLPEIAVQDSGEALSAIVAFAHARRAPGEIVAALRERKINAAAPTPAYAPLWFGAGRPPVARLSPHAFTTEAELESAVAAIAAL